MDRLNSYKEKLILFPRREGKPKKGEINDATAERLASAAASAQTAGNLPITHASKAVTFEPITQKDRDTKCYRTLRTARTFKHYKGRREDRAKKEAEKAK